LHRVGGIAEEDFTGRAADVFSLFGLPSVVVDTVHWIYSDPRDDRPVTGGVTAVWLAVLTVGLAAWLLVRTRRALSR